jgi:hypothetical protein
MVSICLTIPLLLLCACTITLNIQTPSSQTGAGDTSATTRENQIACTVFQAINQSRAANGLPPLSWSNALAKSARQNDLAIITIYKDDTLCYTATKVEDLPYSWLPRNDE